MCQEGRQRCADDLELPWEQALLLRDTGDVAGALGCLHQLLSMPQGQFFASRARKQRALK